MGISDTFEVYDVLVPVGFLPVPRELDMSVWYVRNFSDAMHFTSRVKGGVRSPECQL